MNELTTYKTALPSNVEEVADFVVLNEEKLNAVKVAIRAAKKAGAINLEELERQQRELEITTVLAQCKLGELTKGIETASHDRGNRYSSKVQDLDSAKKTQLENMGLTKQRASEYERMSEHPDIVDRVIDSGEHVTKAAILKAIKKEERENTIIEQVERPRSGAYVDIFKTDKKYRVIYADPPWSYDDKQNTDSLGGAEKHYMTMPFNDICSLPIPSENNAVLFIWVTSPMLENVFKVINAWGFKYKSSFVWDKIAHNMGHYNSVRHELLLICTKGSCTPDVKRLFDSVVSIERTEHSRKPKEFRDMIDILYPNGNRLEMFAREAPEGWDVWGNMA